MFIHGRRGPGRALVRAYAYQDAARYWPDLKSQISDFRTSFQFPISSFRIDFRRRRRGKT
jgi:hypothetical protein